MFNMDNIKFLMINTLQNTTFNCDSVSGALSDPYPGDYTDDSRFLQ